MSRTLEPGSKKKSVVPGIAAPTSIRSLHRSNPGWWICRLGGFYDQAAAAGAQRRAGAYRPGLEQCTYVTCRGQRERSPSSAAVSCPGHPSAMRRGARLAAAREPGGSRHAARPACAAVAAPFPSAPAARGCSHTSYGSTQWQQVGTGDDSRSSGIHLV